MARYRILIKPSAVKETEEVGSKRDRQRIASRIGKLAKDPRPQGCEKLSGRDRYRIRQGRCRILYSIEDRDLVAYVVKVGHRRKVCK